MEPILISADQLAKILDVSVRTIWRLRDTGRLPASLRIGAGVRWRRDVIQNWINEGCPRPDSRENN